MTADTGEGGRHRDSGELLLDAVRDLTRVAAALQKTLSEDYPKRKELEDGYVSRDGIRRSRRQFAAAVAVAILFSCIVTLGSVSYCFLQGKTYTACSVIPGYSTTVTRSRKLSEQRDKATRENKQQAATIHQLEIKVDQLSKRIGN
jgi:hypothetical protein